MAYIMTYIITYIMVSFIVYISLVKKMFMTYFGDDVITSSCIKNCYDSYRLWYELNKMIILAHALCQIMCVAKVSFDT